MIVPQQATLEPRGLGAKRISEAPDMRKRVTSAIILCGYPPGRAMQTTTFSAGDAASDPDGKGVGL